MVKKAIPEKGMRTVTIEFAGKTRTLKWGHSISGEFEIEANQILRSTGVVKDGMIFAEGLLQNWLGNARILTLALRYALKHDDPSLTTQAIDEGIDAYLQEGHSKRGLTRAIITAFAYATDPSSVASLTKNWKNLDEREQFLEKLNQKKMEEDEKILADAKARMTGGSIQSDLPKSNSDSDQTKSES